MKKKNFAYVILALNAFLGWVSYWSLGRSIFGADASFKWTMPFALFSLWAIVFSLSVIFVKDRRWIYGSIALASLAYLAFVDHGLSVIGLLFGILVLFYAERTAKRELASGVHIHFYKVVNQPLKYFVSSACLIAAVAYYFSLDKQEGLNILDIDTELMRKEIEVGLEVARNIFSDKEELIREIQSGMTVDEYIVKTQLSDADAMLKDYGIGSGMEKDMPVPIDGDFINNAIRDQALAVSKKKVSEDLGIEVAGNEPVKELLVTFVDKKQEDFLAEALPKKTIVSVILAIGFFLAVRLIGTAIDLVLGFVIMGIIKILISTGIVTMKKEIKEVSVVEYSV